MTSVAVIGTTRFVRNPGLDHVRAVVRLYLVSNVVADASDDGCPEGNEEIGGAVTAG